MEVFDAGCRPWDDGPTSIDDFYAMLEPPVWHAAAACRHVDVDFFPQRGVADHRAAVEVCRTCPVSTHCLAAALQCGDVPGIWGGSTQRERRRLRAEP